MKKRILSFTGLVIMATAIVLSGIQLRIPVARAYKECPYEAWIAGCPCFIKEFTVLGVGDDTATFCWYTCNCAPTGGGEPFEIEQLVVLQ